MMPETIPTCLTCYGAGETATELGPRACADCFGEGKALGGGAKLEWRLRDLERECDRSGGAPAADVLWLVHELRRGQRTLLQILARCQDADDANALARDIKFEANAALGVYEPEPSRPA